VRACAACGRPLGSDRRSTAKYCDDTCRKHFQRGARADVVVRMPVPVQKAGDPVPLMALDEIARELAATIADPATPRTALAGLSREYRATLAAIEAAAPKPSDAVDELFARRAARLGTGGSAGAPR
jgi:hypothetical protein